MALAPEELELDPMAMTQKYEEHVREQQAQVEKEDFSDMVAEHAAKQKVGVPSGGQRPRRMGKSRPGRCGRAASRGFGGAGGGAQASQAVSGAPQSSSSSPSGDPWALNVS